MAKIIKIGDTIPLIGGSILGVRTYLSEDLISTQIPYAGFSLRRINKSYTGPIIEVWNSETENFTDIYTNKETLDKNYLLSLVDSSGNLYVSKWYDQYNSGYYIDLKGEFPLPLLINGSTFYSANSNPKSFGISFANVSTRFDYSLKTTLSNVIMKCYCVVSQINTGSYLIMFSELDGTPQIYLDSYVRLISTNGEQCSFPSSSYNIFNLSINLGKGDTLLDNFNDTQYISKDLIKGNVSQLNLNYIDENYFDGILHELIITEEGTMNSGSSDKVFQNQNTYFFKV